MEYIIEEYWQAVRERVFVRCIDERDGAGTVRLTNEAQCVIKMFLADIINIVNTVHSDRMEPYVDVLHHTVCAKCDFAKPDGSCELRDRADCCLERYFPLVVEAIEEVNAQHDNHEEFHRG